jgi:hypothetical protein
MRCLGCVLRAGPDAVPSFDNAMFKRLRDKLFMLIHKYSAPGMSVTDNVEMIRVAFKVRFVFRCLARKLEIQNFF